MKTVFLFMLIYAVLVFLTYIVYATNAISINDWVIIAGFIIFLYLYCHYLFQIEKININKAAQKSSFSFVLNRARFQGRQRLLLS